MNATTVNKSQVFRLRRSLWAAPLACLALGLALACSGGYGPDDAPDGDEDADVIEDNATVATDADTVQDKALLRTSLVAATPCEDCQMEERCFFESIECNPPIEVNGRKIHCLERVCKEVLVCRPCGSRAADPDVIDSIDLDGLGPELGGLGGITPIDPVPFSF
jgi:hypothetical protein